MKKEKWILNQVQNDKRKFFIKKKGFTLVELVVTIVVIITLSAISVPMYKNHKEKAMLAEGYILLSAIRDAQKQYYAEYGNFLTVGTSAASHWVNSCDALGIDAIGNKYFTEFAPSGYSGYYPSNYKWKYYFLAALRMPAGLGGNGFLALQYNITLGQKFVYMNKDYDSSWE